MASDYIPGIDRSGPRYTTAPAVFIRIRDLLTSESIVINDVLASASPTVRQTGGIVHSLNITRQIGQPGTATFTLLNKGKKYFQVPPMPSSDNTQPIHPPSIFYDQGFYADARARNIDGSLEGGGLATPNIIKGSTSRDVSKNKAVDRTKAAENPVYFYGLKKEIDFFRSLYTHNSAWQEQNQERAALLGEMISGKLDDTTFGSALERVYKTSLLLDFRAQVDIDIQDARGFWFPAFTGFIKSITDIETARDVPGLSISCGDFMTFFNWAQFPLLKSQYPTADTQNSVLLRQYIPGNPGYAFSSALAGKTDSQVMDLLVNSVNTLYTMEGSLQTARQLRSQEYTNFRLNRIASELMRSRSVAGSEKGVASESLDTILSRQNPSSSQDISKVFPYFSPEDPFFKKKVRKATLIKDGLDERFYVSEKDSFVNVGVQGPLQQLSLEKLWDGPALYFGTCEMISPSLVQNPKVFRTGMPYVRDQVDALTSTAIQTILQTGYNYFMDSTSPAMEIAHQVLSRTLADFYCTGAGWLVYKYPRINSMPNVDYSPFEDAGIVKAEKLGGIVGQTPNELFHGKEYVMQDYVSRKFNLTEAGRYTRAFTVGSVKVVDKLGPQVEAVTNAFAFAPIHLAAALGDRILQTTEVLKNADFSILKRTASLLMSYHNVSVNSAEFSYDHVLPWELGKTVYVPETDFIYTINSLSLDYQQGQRIGMTLACRHGHPRRMVVPVPWLMWTKQAVTGKPALEAQFGLVQNLLLVRGAEGIKPSVVANVSKGEPGIVEFTRNLYTPLELEEVYASTMETADPKSTPEATFDNMVSASTQLTSDAAEVVENTAKSALDALPPSTGGGSVPLQSPSSFQGLPGSSTPTL